jgi:hypothetical protein
MSQIGFAAAALQSESETHSTQAPAGPHTSLAAERSAHELVTTSQPTQVPDGEHAGRSAGQSL